MTVSVRKRKTRAQVRIAKTDLAYREETATVDPQ